MKEKSSIYKDGVPILKNERIQQYENYEDFCQQRSTYISLIFQPFSVFLTVPPEYVDL